MLKTHSLNPNCFGPKGFTCMVHHVSQIATSLLASDPHFLHCYLLFMQPPKQQDSTGD
jgi:hypothetical protein